MPIHTRAHTSPAVFTSIVIWFSSFMMSFSHTYDHDFHVCLDHQLLSTSISSPCCVRDKDWLRLTDAVTLYKHQGAIKRLRWDPAHPLISGKAATGFHIDKPQRQLMAQINSFDDKRQHGWPGGEATTHTCSCLLSQAQRIVHNPDWQAGFRGRKGSVQRNLINTHFVLLHLIPEETVHGGWWNRTCLLMSISLSTTWVP